MKYPQSAALASRVRERTGDSHEEFGKTIRSNRRSVYEWEGGDRQPSRAHCLILTGIDEGWIDYEKLKQVRLLCD